ncbi:hypothetical protein BJ322DRAFT_1023656 [Thelephora terrestris]|uniref:Uncharacterized protein n=1 Tax=Thelephora terrestris TaxID=56493 RepID=A0A9P6H9E7_9AGAM|nr:hypothetical protein BJ322DRAFT_1023656 [Thelephora terrestris]
MDSPEEEDNDEQSGEDCVHSQDNKTKPASPDPANILYTPTHHDANYHASPASRPTRLHSLRQIHTCPGDPPLPLSTSSEPDVTCRRDDSVDQNESSDSCGSSSSGIAPPSDELGQDSREGMGEEEFPDPGGGEGMTGDLQGGMGSIEKIKTGVFITGLLPELGRSVVSREEVDGRLVVLSNGGRGVVQVLFHVEGNIRLEGRGEGGSGSVEHDVVGNEGRHNSAGNLGEGGMGVWWEWKRDDEGNNH